MNSSLLSFTVLISLLIISGVALIWYNNFLTKEKKENFRAYIRTYFGTRGTPSERALLRKLLSIGFNNGAIFHDLYLRKASGHFSQIDLVLATKVGIIVFEVKDYTGWIFGNAYQEKWTKVVSYGRDRYQFYNPILQNRTHVENLKKDFFYKIKCLFFSGSLLWRL